jgi:hypothetical protein
MAYNKLTQCVICIEGQKKEDDFSCRQIGKRVFYSFQNQEEEEEGEEEKEERNIFTCDSCHFWEARADGFSGVVPMAWTIMHAKEWTARKEAGLTDFNGSLFFPDGDVNIPKFKEVRDRSSRLRTLNNRGITIQMPVELSDEASRQPYIRTFYQKYTMAAGIVIQPGESHKVALNRQDPRVQDNHTIRLRHKLDHAIEWENWATAQELFDQILDVNPLQRRPPTPTEEKGEPEPKRSRRDDEEPQSRNERRLCYSCRQRGHEIKDCPIEEEFQPGPLNPHDEE